MGLQPIPSGTKKQLKSHLRVWPRSVLLPAVKAPTALPNALPPLAGVDAELVGKDCVELLQKHLLRLHALGDHPNRTLGFDQMLVTLLLAFQQPCDRTLRLMDDLSQADSAAEHLPSGRSARSTMSDALAAFDPRHLDPLPAELAAMLPGLQQTDSDPHALLNRRILIADGSVFTVPIDVAWAITVSRSNKAPGKQLRLNLQLDMVRGPPASLSVRLRRAQSSRAGHGQNQMRGAVVRAGVQPAALWRCPERLKRFRGPVGTERRPFFACRVLSEPSGGKMRDGKIFAACGRAV